jgi:hypothetical protein
MEGINLFDMLLYACNMVSEASLISEQDLTLKGGGGQLTSSGIQTTHPSLHIQGAVYINWL